MRNANMTNRAVKTRANLTPQAKTILDTAAEKFELSDRAYMRCAKVARTIADLAEAPDLREEHVAEAVGRTI
jgi:magnesium chelatase family protein